MEKTQAVVGVMHLIKKNGGVFSDSNNIVMLGKLMNSCPLVEQEMELLTVWNYI